MATPSFILHIIKETFAEGFAVLGQELYSLFHNETTQPFPFSSLHAVGNLPKTHLSLLGLSRCCPENIIESSCDE